MSKGVIDRPILETPIAIIDFETTGLAPGPDRVVEVSVVRAEPGKEPVLVLDTLINPDRPMAATEIHGITDRDVVDAPRFFEIGGDFIRAISGCVVASYNVYFDIGFLTYELRKIRVACVPPHVCLMYLRPLLEMGKRCSLFTACCESGIPLPHAHQSAADAFASAQLWKIYLSAMEEHGMQKFKDLSQKKQYKFLNSLEADPLSPPTEAEMPHLANVKSRSVKMQQEYHRGGAQPPTQTVDRHDVIHRYWSELTTVLSDLELTRDEANGLAKLRNQLKLTQEEIKGMHARVFADLLLLTIEDRIISADEQNQIQRLYRCLAKLGWAPGQ